ncbi:MAG: transglutaminase-like domain-containing protein [Pirellulales bacterium]|nr:transglutaminase-like domain-containing protein [Pirellulales bacterium]
MSMSPELTPSESMSPTHLHRQMLLGAAFAFANGIALCLLRLEGAAARGAIIWESIVSLAVPPIVLAVLIFSRRAFVLANHYHTFLVIAWAFWPILLHAALRIQGYGDAYEIVAILCLHHGSAAAIWGDCSAGKLRAVYVMGGLVTLMITVLAITPAVLFSCGVTALVGFCWLSTSYWQRFDDAPRAEQLRNRRRIRWGLIVVLLAGFGIVLLADQGRPAAYFLSGFMPSSGGQGLADELARGGVGDGEALVAAEEQASSFGALETELFLESDMPSLYDAFSELYGEPPPPSKQKNRAISLAMSDIEEVKQERASNLRAGKEFSAARSSLHRKDLEDLDSPSLLHIHGNVPLHLRLETFDSFDGAMWTNTVDWRAELDAPQLSYKTGEPWVMARSSSATNSIESNSEHTLKFINLKSERVPSPPQLFGVHVDKLNRDDMFAWKADGNLAMDGVDYIPQLTTMDVRSSHTRLQPLREHDFTESYQGSTPESNKSELCAADSQSIVQRHLTMSADDCGYRSLAESWVAGVPRGWQQVEAVVSRLREEFVVDRSAVPPEDCEDVIAYFLQSRRGPDFLFATTAALMLRSQGYPTRLVTGFYADPDRYDYHSDSTAVLMNDVHAWAEVLVHDTGWVAIEPTPGYSPPPEWRSWWDWCKFASWAILTAAIEHWVALILGAIVVLLAIRFRVELANLLLSLIAGIASLLNPKRKLDWTLWLLDRRSSLAGFPRPASAPVSSWHSQLTDSGRLNVRTLDRFLRFVEQRLYAVPPRSLSGIQKNESEIAGVCREVRSQASLGTVRAAFRFQHLPAKSTLSNKKWKQCPPGEINQACRRWKSRTRVKRLVFFGLATVMAGLAATLICRFC